MKILIKISFLLFFMIFTNCSDLKKGLGIEKDIPDEFMVKKGNPIERPPNYDLLPPDTKNNNADIKSPQNKTNDNIISILDSATNQNPENQKKGNSKVKNVGDLENVILKELSK